jgi:hypothetical protein
MKPTPPDESALTWPHLIFMMLLAAVYLAKAALLFIPHLIRGIHNDFQHRGSEVDL